MAKFEIELEDGSKFEIETEEQSEPIASRFGRFVGETSPTGTAVLNRASDIASGIQSEVISPLASGASQFAFNIPRAIATPEQERAIFPEPQTRFGKGLKTVSEAGGLLAGGAGRLATKAASKAGGSLIRKGAVGGGTFGLTQQASEQDISSPDVSGQIGRGVFGAATGGALGTAITPFRNLAQGKFAQDFINKQLAPKAVKLYQKAVDNFTPAIRQFAKNTLKVSDDVLGHINKVGTKTINQAKETLDDVVVNLRSGLDNKLKQVNETYSKALGNLPESPVINIDKSVKSLSKMLQKNGFIDDFGNLTQRARDPLADPVLKTLAGEYQALVGQTGAQVTKVARDRIGAVNKFVWENLKDRISTLNSRAGKQTPDITKVLDQLHDDAANAGAKGIEQARSLAREFFNNESVVNKFINEKALNRIFKFTGDEMRNLKQVEKYLGVNVESTIKNFVAKSDLNKIKQFGVSRDLGADSAIVTKMKEAQNPVEFEKIRGQFREILGNSKEVDVLFNELKSFLGTKKLKKGLGIITKTGALGGVAGKSFGLFD